MNKIKIYSNRRDVKQLKRTLDLRERSWKETKKGALKIERLNQKRIKQKKEEEKSGWTETKKKNVLGWSKNVLGWKSFFGLKNVWAEKKSILGWKIKGNRPKEKKKMAGRKEKKKKGRLTRKKKRKRSVRCWKKKKRRVGTKKGCRIDNFSAFIFLRIFSKKIMVNSFVLDLIF